MLVVIGNKIDLRNTKYETVSKEEAVEFFDKHSIPSCYYFETSAKTGQGVNELFINAIRIWYNKKMREKDLDESSKKVRVEIDNEMRSMNNACIIA